MGRHKGSKNKIDKGIYLNCKVCSRLFRVKPYRKSNALYCCLSCKSIAIYDSNKFTMRGSSAWNKGKQTGLVPKSAFKKGHIPWNTGKGNPDARRLRKCVETAIRRSLKGNKKYGKSWEKILGYSFQELKSHLSRKFKPGMTFANFGKWHIDHILPVSKFNFSSYQHMDFHKCWALSNLQPLWAEDNNRKNAKLEKHFQPSLKLSFIG